MTISADSCAHVEAALGAIHAARGDGGTAFYARGRGKLGLALFLC